MIEYKCPQCAGEMSSPDSMAGEQESCPNCEYLVTVPGAYFPNTPAVVIQDSFFTKIAGVTHDNDNGTSRQAILKRCLPDEQLQLIHDSSNPYDQNAIEVRRANGQQLGYLNADLAAELASAIRYGVPIFATIKNLTGGTRRNPTRGANIEIIIAEPATVPSQPRSGTQTLWNVIAWLVVAMIVWIAMLMAC